MEKALANELIQQFLAYGHEEVEIFHEEKQVHSLRTRRGGEKPEWRVTVGQGVGVRISGEMGMKYLHFPMSPADLLEHVKSGRNTALLREVRSVKQVGDEEDQHVGVSLSAMAAAFEELHDRWQRGFRAAGRVNSRCMESVTSFDQRITVARSDGFYADDHRSYYTIDIQGEWTEESRPMYMSRSCGGLNLEELRAGFAGFVQSALAEFDDLQQYIEIEGGDWCVVLGPGNPAILIHEVCGHGLEGDLAAHPDAVYGGKFGQPVASEQVTLVDDPTIPGLSGSYRVDDEGEKAQSTVLIQNGRLQELMYDRTAAKRWDTHSNGHGRRVSYRYPAIPRMSNTFIQAGEYTPEEIVRQTSRGLYVRKLGTGETELTTGRFRVRVVEGFLIENGRITRPTGDLWLVGNGPDLLSSIDRVGCDLRMHHSRHATCHKFDQMNLAVSVGQPTIRIKKIHVETGAGRS
ncbi:MULTISPECIES: TldD/PmbA family protein [Brevibacillus]|jgi:TldD protein|uniref:TldD/PmbA family protein n=1 Tax=Brevibacillus TaxID=55080 RepID=UPI001BA19D81|nr:MULTISPECIES: TldD/PmbA family protein [Bacillales]MBR8661026.1 TldD/PmbA family protein [Brevibacillus sp. NL20B1]UFJ60900.1 TldD/PmbA family protein [Anoxybacillus sediminis]